MPARTSIVAAGAAAAALALVPAAHAELPVPDVAGAAGGILSGAPASLLAPVTSAVDGILAGGGGTLDPATVGGLVAPLTPAEGAPESSAPAGAGDALAPAIAVSVVSRLRSVHRTGRLALRVAASEPAVVGLGGTMRPGRPLARKRRRAHAASFRTPIHFPTAVLVFRRAGALRVTIAISRAARRRLGRARDARLSLAVLAADAARNQAARRFRRHVAR